jgi:hypothetical protein
VLNRNDHHTLDAKDHDGSMSHLGGGLNRSTQHFILEGKDGV